MAKEKPSAPKPLFRPRNIILALLVLGLLTIGWVVIWSTTASPRVAIDYVAKLQDETAARQPAGEDGWTHITAAIGTWAEIEATLPADGRPPEHAEGLAIDVIWQVTPIPSEAAIEMVRDAIARSAAHGMLDHLDAAANCDRFIQPLESEPGAALIGVIFPDLTDVRNVARFCAARMDLEIRADNAVEAQRSLRHGLTLGRACSRQPFIITHLVGRAVTSLMMSRLRAAIVEGDLDANEIAALMQTLDEETEAGAMDIALEGERAFMLDMIQRFYTDDGNGGGVFLPASTSAGMSLREITSGSTDETRISIPSVFNVAGIFMPRRDAVTARANDFYDALSTRSKLSRAERETLGQDPRTNIESLGRGYFLLKLLLPALEGAIETIDRHELAFAGTRLLLAIEAYRADHGAPPPTLDALVPDFIDVIPAEPYSGGFLYRVLEYDPGGRVYTLYTVGLDGEDNGGTTTESRVDHALQRGRSEGLDYVLNPSPTE